MAVQMRKDKKRGMMNKMNGTQLFIIRCRKKYWSNETGWGSMRGATKYTYEETQRLHLPHEGKYKVKWIQHKESK